MKLASSVILLGLIDAVLGSGAGRGQLILGPTADPLPFKKANISFDPWKQRLDPDLMTMEDYKYVRSAIPDEQKLLRDILTGYNSLVRPVLKHDTAVSVKMGMTLTQIFDVDEQNQMMVSNVWLDHEWKDELLTWNPRKYGNLTVIRVPDTLIWKPDVVLYNNAADFSNERIIVRAMITSEGDVFWPVPAKLFSRCIVDVRYFPYDEQICHFKFGSWTYDGYKLDITNRTPEMVLANEYITNGEWNIIQMSQKRHLRYYTCCVEPYPDVTFYIHIQRRNLYYKLSILFPCFIMMALTLLVFLLPPDSNQKITLGITVLLSFSVFMLSVIEKLPESGQGVPFISVFLSLVLSMTSASTITTVFVLFLHHRRVPNPPPPALQKFVNKILGPICCVRSERKTEEDQVQLALDYHLNGITKQLDWEVRWVKKHLGSGEQLHLVLSLRRVVSRLISTRKSSKVVQSWQDIAVLVDRVLFVLFTVSTLITMVLMPVSAYFGSSDWESRLSYMMNNPMRI